MSEIIDTAKDIAEKKLEENDEAQRKKRFAKYAVLGVNKKVNQQIKRDFTKGTEDKLVTLANSVNADELSYDIRDVLGRWFLNTIIGKFLKQIINTQSIMCDSYNYFGKTIRKIFAQARNADARYSNKLANKPSTIAENSVVLLTHLNSAFLYYQNNKEYGCSIKYALENIYENNDEVIDAINKINSANSEISIEEYVKNEENISVYDEYSGKIYSELKIDDKEIGDTKFGKLIQGHEGVVNRVVNYLVDKLNKYSDSSREGFIETLLEDGEVAKMISALIDATGVTGLGKATLKIYILKRVKEVINRNYQELFKKIQAGQSNDYQQLEELYEQLKDLEKTIITTYRDANEFQPDKQIKANEWLGNLQSEGWTSAYNNSENNTSSGRLEYRGI